MRKAKQPQKPIGQKKGLSLLPVARSERYRRRSVCSASQQQYYFCDEQVSETSR
jgi:hypothetical protein